MDSDSESELLRARFEALKVPIGHSDGPMVKPQLSPVLPTIDRAALEAELRLRLSNALRKSESDTGTEIDEVELERILLSEDEYLDNISDLEGGMSRDELSTRMRELLKEYSDSRPNSRQSRPTQRRDSAKTVLGPSNRYTADSDADDEGAAEDLLRKTREALTLEGSSRSNSSQSSRDPSLGRPATSPTTFTNIRLAKADDYEDDEDTDDERSVKRRHRKKSDSSNGSNGEAGQRTPPSHGFKAHSPTKDVGKYEALFSSLETPRVPPALTPTGEDDDEDPLPAAFARLQGISPSTSKIGNRGRGGERADSKSDLGPAPRLDLEGWRSAKDDKPETWCCICNADATVKCPGCDNDLYCRACYTEGHPDDTPKEGDHRPVDFEAPS